VLGSMSKPVSECFGRQVLHVVVGFVHGARYLGLLCGLT
jgi:hypothetical protein